MLEENCFREESFVLIQLYFLDKCEDLKPKKWCKKMKKNCKNSTVYEKCKKTCNKCDNQPPTPEDCKDKKSKKSCSKQKKAGKCSSKKNKKNCKKTCGHCQSL